MSSLGRRRFLQTFAGAAVLGAAPPRPAGAQPSDGVNPRLFNSELMASRTPPDLTVLDLTVEGDKKLAQRFVLLVPKHLAKDEKVPLLVAFHGQGETWEQGVGAFAWLERYALGNTYARLRRPPIARTCRQILLSDAKLAELNAGLAAQPFKGLAIACPYTPSLTKMPDVKGAHDDYAAWIADVVIPRARKEAPVFADAAHTTLDGVSLGGYASLEIFARRPEVFGGLGVIQAAILPGQIPGYADRIAAARAARPLAAQASFGVHVQTSTKDPMQDINRLLSTELTKRGVPHDFVVLEGPHEALYTRETGGMDMLLWHDRRPR